MCSETEQEERSACMGADRLRATVPGCGVLTPSRWVSPSCPKSGCLLYRVFWPLIVPHLHEPKNDASATIVVRAACPVCAAASGRPIRSAAELMFPGEPAPVAGSRSDGRRRWARLATTVRRGVSSKRSPIRASHFGHRDDEEIYRPRLRERGITVTIERVNTKVTRSICVRMPILRSRGRRRPCRSRHRPGPRLRQGPRLPA